MLLLSTKSAIGRVWSGWGLIRIQVYIYPTLETSTQTNLGVPPLLHTVLSKTMSTQSESLAMYSWKRCRTERLRVGCTPGWGQALQEELGFQWKKNGGVSLVVQWLRFCASNSEGAGSIPGWGTRILLAMWPKKTKGASQPQKKEKRSPPKYFFERIVLRMERNRSLKSKAQN